jgi:opacity protein-like surface antigen
MQRTTLLLFCLILVVGARDASADLTAFVGATQTPSTRTAGGVALSISLLFVGFEFEYSDTREDAAAEAPGLRSGMFNIQVQTPNVGGVRLYGTVGGGLYQERLSGHRQTNLGGNVGGGVKIPIAGPIGVRLDYRVFMLGGDARHTNLQRMYAGFNLAF